jgi:hypothetical protein
MHRRFLSSRACHRHVQERGAATAQAADGAAGPRPPTAQPGVRDTPRRRWHQVRDRLPSRLTLIPGTAPLHHACHRPSQQHFQSHNGQHDNTYCRMCLSHYTDTSMRSRLLPRPSPGERHSAHSYVPGANASAPGTPDQGPAPLPASPARPGKSLVPPSPKAAEMAAETAAALERAQLSEAAFLRCGCCCALVLLSDISVLASGGFQHCRKCVSAKSRHLKSQRPASHEASSFASMLVRINVTTCRAEPTEQARSSRSPHHSVAHSSLFSSSAASSPSKASPEQQPDATIAIHVLKAASPSPTKVAEGSRPAAVRHTRSDESALRGSADAALAAAAAAAGEGRSAPVVGSSPAAATPNGRAAWPSGHSDTSTAKASGSSGSEAERKREIARHASAVATTGGTGSLKGEASSSRASSQAREPCSTCQNPIPNLRLSSGVQRSPYRQRSQLDQQKHPRHCSPYMKGCGSLGPYCNFCISTLRDSSTTTGSCPPISASERAGLSTWTDGVKSTAAAGDRPSNCCCRPAWSQSRRRRSRCRRGPRTHPSASPPSRGRGGCGAAPPSATRACPWRTAGCRRPCRKSARRPPCSL